MGWVDWKRFGGGEKQFSHNLQNHSTPKKVKDTAQKGRIYFEISFYKKIFMFCFILRTLGVGTTGWKKGQNSLHMPNYEATWLQNP